MNIFVLMKRTFDTEERISLLNDKINEDGAEFIINPYDEYAIEEAIQVRDRVGGTVTVITVGDNNSETQLRTSLAMGADKAVLIQLEDDQEDFDSYSISQILAHYLSSVDAHLILAGNMAIDGGSGQVGPRVAELLGINCVTSITNLKLDGNLITIIRDVEGDLEKIETALPLLVTTQQGLNEPRYPSLPGIMKAKKKPLERLGLSDLKLDEVVAKTKTVTIFLPAKREAGKILEGDSNKQVHDLVQLLRTEAKII